MTAKKGKDPSLKKSSKQGKRKSLPLKEVKKSAIKKVVKKFSIRAEVAPPGLPCICMKFGRFWFCMKKQPDGTLSQCDGPFRSEAICNAHGCEE